MKPWIKSAFFPGLGQIHCGRIKDGILIVISLTEFYVLWSVGVFGELDTRWDWLPEWTIDVYKFGVPIIFVLIWVMNVVNAAKIPTCDRSKRTSFSSETLIGCIVMLIDFLLVLGMPFFLGHS